MQSSTEHALTGLNLEALKDAARDLAQQFDSIAAGGEPGRRFSGEDRTAARRASDILRDMAETTTGLTRSRLIDTITNYTKLLDEINGRAFHSLEDGPPDWDSRL